MSRDAQAPKLFIAILCLLAEMLRNRSAEKIGGNHPSKLHTIHRETLAWALFVPSLAIPSSAGRCQISTRWQSHPVIQPMEAIVVGRTSRPCANRLRAEPQ